MQVVYAGEDLPETITSSLFLAGPTPRTSQVMSWRPDALRLLQDMGYGGTVFVPEPREGVFLHSYDDQIEWEERCLNVADQIVFWVPRNLSIDENGQLKMPAFTTNVEWGMWCDTGKVVFGAPIETPKNTYLAYYAQQYKVPMFETLTETLHSAMEKVGKGVERSGGERFVPLMIWQTASFQSWYAAQTQAGNRLNYARPLYVFRPGNRDFVFLWILQVDVYIASEDRHKTNEFVLARTDISSVVMYRGDQVALVKEFRSPAATVDGFIRELPGGSANATPTETAAEEIHEETGLYVNPDRLKAHGARQLLGTLSSHKAHLYSVELSEQEMEWLRSQKDIAHGNQEDSERTFVELYSVDELLQQETTDWSTLGMVLSIFRH